MNPDTLHSLMLSGQPHVILNVLPPEVFAARHIAGSLNACVYETAFIDKVRALGIASDGVIVVCGAGGGSRDSAEAAAKLDAAGFNNVMVLDGGIEGWLAAAYPAGGHGDLPAPPVIDGIYQVCVADSVIRWTGRNPFNHHSGTLRLASGEIVARQGVLESARFTIDMESIACEDLPDAQLNAMLLNHLKHADFFETSRFPTAEFVIESARPIAGACEGLPNHTLRGALTLRGIAKPMGFAAVIAGDGDRLTGQAQIEIDRTDFGSIYGSGRFFRFLGKHVVNDHIQLHLKIHADRSRSLD
jgi:polyisoprenoid-binding protein YceI